jgi:hypothetical protein
MDHTRFVASIGDFLDGKLDLVEYADFVAHMRSCHECSKTLARRRIDRLDADESFSYAPCQECFKAETLRRWFNFDLPLDVCDLIDEHLEGCQSCYAEMVRVADEEVLRTAEDQAAPGPAMGPLAEPGVSPQDTAVAGTGWVGERMQELVDSIWSVWRQSAQPLVAAVVRVADLLAHRGPEPATFSPIPLLLGSPQVGGQGESLVINLAEEFGSHILKNSKVPVPDQINKQDVARRLGNRLLEEKLPWSAGYVTIQSALPPLGSPGQDIALAATAPVRPEETDRHEVLRLCLVTPEGRTLRAELTAGSEKYGGETFAEAEPGGTPDTGDFANLRIELGDES